MSLPSAAMNPIPPQQQSSSPPGSISSRLRARDVFPQLVLGRHPTGPLNSLTDVPGVLVHTESIHRPNTATSQAVNTGVTVILPRRDWFDRAAHAGIFSFNGSGEMTGSHWIAETGLLRSPIVITNSFAVGAAYDGVYRWAIREHADPATRLADWFLLPVVAETYDGYMSDIAAMAVTPEMVVRGIDNASADAVPEGNTGGGTGMLCSGFKAGTGSASRRIRAADGTTTYTVGALVQTNFGKNWDLKFGGVPVGKLMMDPTARKEHEKNMKAGGELEAQQHSDQFAKPREPVKDGSIIIIIATDAPLHPTQLQRMARRAATGMSRVGGWGSNTSGDIFLAFSTAPDIKGDQDMNWNPVVTTQPQVEDNSINALFEAAADSVEESIYNSLTMAQSMVGPKGRSVEAMDLNKLRAILERWYCTE